MARKSSKSAKDLISMYGSKAKAAKAAGISRNTLDNALKGKAKSESLEKIGRIVAKEQEQLRKDAIYLTAALGQERAAAELGISENTLRAIRKGKGTKKTGAVAKAKSLIPKVKADPAAKARVNATIQKKTKAEKKKGERINTEADRQSNYYFDQILKLPYGKEALRVMSSLGNYSSIPTKHGFPMFAAKRIRPNHQIREFYSPYVVVVFKNYNYFKADIGDQCVMLSPFALTLKVGPDDTPDSIADKIMDMFGPGGKNHKPEMLEILGFFFSDEPPGRK